MAGIDIRRLRFKLEFDTVGFDFRLNIEGAEIVGRLRLLHARKLAQRIAGICESTSGIGRRDTRSTKVFSIDNQRLASFKTVTRTNRLDCEKLLREICNSAAGKGQAAVIFNSRQARPGRFDHGA